MTAEQAVDTLINFKGNILVVGVIHNGKGEYDVATSICETKEDLYSVLDKYLRFEVFYLKRGMGSKGEGFYRNEFLKFKNAEGGK